MRDAYDIHGSDAAERSDREVERVLQALAAIEPPLELERRVLARVAQAREHKRNTAWIPGMAVAAACVAAVAVLLSLQPWAGSQPANSGRAALVPPELPNPSNRVNAAQLDLRGAAQPEPRENRQPAAMRARWIAKPEPGTERLSAEEMLAWKEMRAPSQPDAPPTLTNNERMLLRVAQDHGAQALATVDQVREEHPESKQDDGAGMLAPAKAQEPHRDVASALQAGLFAGMKAATDE